MRTAAPYRQPRVWQYDRDKAVEYAHRWAFGRNPAYFNFDGFGGDCTNFASQCIYSGSGMMNYAPVYGWFYVNSSNRTASWTGVNYLYDFLVKNTGAGPFAERVDVRDIKPGDIVQLEFDGDKVFNHSPVIVQVGNPVRLDNILVAAHTYNADNRKLTSYSWKDIRFIHIKGVRAR